MNNVPNLRFNEFSGEWESLKISETLKIKHGRDQKKIQVEDGIYPILATGGEIGRTNIPLYDKESVLIGRKGTIDKPIYMNSPFWTVDTLFYSEIKNNMVPKFIFYKFQNINWRKYCEASGVPSLSASTIEGIRYNVPQKQEQEKIASFFSLIDKKIELQTEKVEELKNYKKGIMQKIFSQELRFKDENGNEYPEWEEHTLGKLIKVKSIRNKDNKVELVLSVSNTKGFITQAEQFEDRVVASSDISNYKIVEKDDFAFNPARINVGSIARLKTHEKGIVSPMYVCFNCLNLLDSSYFEYFLMTHSFDVQMKKKLEGSVRQTLSAEALSEIKIKLPTLLEQKKIGEFLNKISAKIEKEEVKLVQLEKYKKGLLQQMFI